MATNRLFKKNRSCRPQVAASVGPSTFCHEAVEVSLCDEGMCFCSEVQHEVGAVLLVDFEPDATLNDVSDNTSLRTEAVVVECRRSGCGRAYDITVLFTGN